MNRTSYLERIVWGGGRGEGKEGHMRNIRSSNIVLIVVVEGLLKDSDKKNDKYTHVHCTGYLLLLPLSHCPAPHVLYAHLSPLIL